MPKEAFLPRFTPGGIQAPTSDDKIKDGTSPSALADNFWALAQTADNQANTVANAARVAATDAAALDATAKANAAESKSKAYADQVVNTSHLALDTDGTPYVSPGSMTLRIFMDTDGNPYFREA